VTGRPGMPVYIVVLDTGETLHVGPDEIEQLQREHRGHVTDIVCVDDFGDDGEEEL
jgi:hypothetical protein